VTQALVLLDQEDFEIPTGETCSECGGEVVLVVQAGEVAVRCACGMLAILD
jgi:hypothetical protein